MRGWTSDFTPYTRVEPVTLNFMPPDFDPSYIDFYADKPLAPEVVECERCNPARCHARIRARGETLKPDCAAFLALDAPPAPRRSAVQLTPEQLIDRILATLSGGEIMSLYDIMDVTSLTVGTVRKYVTLLVEQGRIATAGWRTNPGSRGANGTQRLYCLPEYKPADVKERAPRKSRRTNEMKELGAANDAKTLAMLREYGPCTSERLAELVGVSNHCTRQRLLRFEAEGQVRRAGEQIILCGRAGTSRVRAGLWQIVEGR